MDTLTIIIAGGILLIAIIVAFMLGNRRNWRILKSSPAVEEPERASSPVDHYTEMRDDLTLDDAGVEEDEEEDEETSSGGFNFVSLATSLIGIGVVVMVGFLVISNVKSALPPEQLNTTIMGFGGATMNDVMGWLPTMIIVPAILFVIMSVFGIMGGSSSSDPPRKDRVRAAIKKKKGVAHYTAIRDELSRTKK